MLGSTSGRIHPRTPAQPRPRAGVVLHGDLDTRRDGVRALQALPVERPNGEGRNVEIVRTEPRDVAPVIPLPVRMHSNRVIQPLDVPAGTPLGERLGLVPESFDPGPLARALMALDRADAD